MTIQKIKSGRVNNVEADNFVGDKGTIFFNESVGDLRISDGLTVGGIPLTFGGGNGGNYTLPTASTTIKGGVKIDGTTIAINNQVISVGTVPYSSLSGTPTIPTNNNQLSNGAGYITSSSLTGLATETYVTSRGYITSSSLTGLATETYVTTRGYITNSALANYALTSAVPTNNNQLSNGAGYITSSALTGYALTAAIPTDISQLTDTQSLLGQGGGGTTYITNNVENPFSFSVAGDDSTLREIANGESIKFTGAGGITITTDAEGNVTITGTPVSLAGYATESYVTSRGYLTTVSWDQLTNKPDLAGTYNWSIAADDSTLREISAGESVKFTGAGGITTASDAEGNITITGPNLSSYATQTYVTTQGYITSAELTGLATESFVTTRGYITGLSWNQLTDKPNLAGTYSFNVAADDSTSVAVNADNTIKFIGGTDVSTTVDADGNVTINFDNATGYITSSALTGLATETFVTTQGYITSSALTGLATESYVNSRGYITGLSWNDLTDKPNLAGTYSWSIAADDSTQIEISTGNLVKIKGAGGITTASNADGQITITGPDLSLYATQSYVNAALSSAGITISPTAPTGLLNGALWYNSAILELYVRYDDAWVAAAASFSGDYNDLTNKPTNLSQFTNDREYTTRDEVYAMILELSN